MQNLVPMVTGAIRALHLAVFGGGERLAGLAIPIVGAVSGGRGPGARYSLRRRRCSPRSTSHRAGLPNLKDVDRQGKGAVRRCGGRRSATQWSVSGTPARRLRTRRAPPTGPAGLKIGCQQIFVTVSTHTNGVIAFASKSRRRYAKRPPKAAVTASPNLNSVTDAPQQRISSSPGRIRRRILTCRQTPTLGCTKLACQAGFVISFPHSWRVGSPVVQCCT